MTDRPTAWGGAAQTLILDNNGIERISGLEGMRFLRVLSVVNNRIQSTDGIVSENLREVYLHQNEIDVLGPTFKDLAALQVGAADRLQH